MTHSVIRLSPDLAKGRFFNLGQIFCDLNTRYFDGKIQAHIAWGRRTKAGLKKRSIRLGSYHHQSQTITISPSLDQPEIPLICVERIVFHEMNHQKFPIKRGKGGRNLIHYREFNDFEKNYPYLKPADSWIKANLNRLLTY